MPFKARGDPTGFREIDRYPGGVGWIAHPGETMARASHALATDAGVWLVDPLDAPGLDDLLAGLGEVAGVVATVDRHARDAAELARRHGVAVHVPRAVDLDPDAPVEPVGRRLGETGFRAIETVSWPGWSEVSLFDGETLVVGDALGTAPHFTAGDESLGVHPFLRLSPPGALADLDPDRVLVGHGTGVHDGAAAALARALRTARRRLPRAWLSALSALVS